MRIILLISVWLICFLSFGQEINSILQRPNIRIGEQATFVIKLKYDDADGTARIGWPQFSEELTKDIEIIDRTVDYATLVDSVKGTFLREQKLFITSFEPGTFVIPPFEVEFNDSVYFTEQVILNVETVAIDTSKGIYDIQPNYTVDYSFQEKLSDFSREYGIWFLLLLLPLITWGIWKYSKSKQSKYPVEIQKPKIPAHISAMEKLTLLAKNEAWSQENKKRYYSELTDTIRKYLEDRFSIYAMEQTTREIIENLSVADISEEDKNYLREILNQADMVKFAKVKPQEEDGRIALNKSIDFVTKTKKENVD